MLKVQITKNDGEVELAIVEIECLEVHEDETADYTVRFCVERSGAVGAHQRMVYHFPRTKYNALALLLQALNTLDPKELELEDGTSASDLAGRQRSPRGALQSWTSRLRNH